MTVTKWTTLTRQCLLRRMSVSEFGDLVRSSGEIDGKKLFSALVECRASFCVAGDPLISLYLDHVGSSGLLSISDALLVLISKWNAAGTPWSQTPPECYGQTLQDLTMLVVSPKYKMTASEARIALLISSRWLSSVVRALPHELADSSSTGYTHVIEALGFLVASIAATDGGLEALSPADSQKADAQAGPGPGPGPEPRESLRHAFESCLPLYSTLSAQLMERLNTVLKHISLLDSGNPQEGTMSAQSSAMQALQFQVSIPESQMVASKAATIMYLESLLLTGATVDDSTAVNFICSRHQNDYHSAFTDLLRASFHILKTQALHPPRRLCYQQCQLFVQNKLPILLSMISASSFNSFHTEQAITETWAQVAPLLSDQVLAMTGSRFLHTCSLHHLMTVQAATQLMGSDDLPNSLSRGLYAKDDLVSQVRTSHMKGPKLVDELVRGDGSAPFISQSLVEIMHSYCHSKETQYLKELANMILRKPAAINCIALFIRPAYWLGPLCTLLDDWRWDEIHGEAQPVYDEFGAVFLLVLVTKTRLGLSNSDIGVRKKDGFLAQYLDQENPEESLDGLSEEKKTHLGNWINALYLAEGLSDELFTSCSPHDFYLLIPALLQQSVAAHHQGKLTQESLKAGLDYLLEPFLLPSLIPALNCIGSLLRENPTSAGIVLEALVKSPESADSQAIHQTILATCAPQLETNIRAFQPGNFDSVLKLLEQCPESSFSSAEHQEVQLQDGQLLHGLQSHLVALIASHGVLDVEKQASSPNVPAMVRRAVEVQGVEAALRALVGVLLQLSDSPDFLFSLDAVATLVTMTGNELRDILRVQYGTLGTLLKKGETLSAEAVVRLHRLVEAYTNLLAVHDMGLDSFSFAQQLTNIDTTNPNLDGNATASRGIDLQTETTQTDGIDQVLDEVAAMSNMDSNDADMNFDALYGLQSADMDLNDLDLDMF
ncbi:hypothetical protein A1O3_08439 [Capronia epimyces CBS 606.96]|uniref:Mediator of RNA polymerase II transcription subunit 5 n=1 Tax=Capronia epimyces CBS 606.96 TaxID=1182542 RepID=W9Y990_9EURO|nr:uncharacterized protein A1O3_08439 [Capronia epimyces CBS 606.96]EXJ78939.1 hypothetical protein A1O3_08439 [Capronia epimyces CBS 606.96]